MVNGLAGAWLTPIRPSAMLMAQGASCGAGLQGLTSWQWEAWLPVVAFTLSACSQVWGPSAASVRDEEDWKSCPFWQSGVRSILSFTGTHPPPTDRTDSTRALFRAAMPMTSKVNCMGTPCEGGKFPIRCPGGREAALSESRTARPEL